MKIDNRGFAVSAFMYMILVLAMILILATLAILSSRRLILDKQKNTAIENITQSRKKICKAVNGVRSLTPGTKYECKVNDEDKFYFYVLSVNGGQVNLIMDRNICEDGTVNYTEENDYCKYAWYDDGDNPVNYENDTNIYGPVTAMTKLYSGTKDWTNVPDMNFEYKDESNIYGTIKTADNGIYITLKNETIDYNKTPTITYDGNKQLKARIAKQIEIISVGCKIWVGDDDTTYGSCPDWAVENLVYFNVSNYSVSEYKDKYSININNGITNIYGYWILSSQPDRHIFARHVANYGAVGGYNTTKTYGVRPVITVLKSNLSY